MRWPCRLSAETLMMGFRLDEGISAGLFEQRFGSPFQEIFPGALGSWVSRVQRDPPVAGSR